ncbi:peptidoglycan binding domain-containing protein [Ruminococcus sp. SR1/5]|uniref:peptidoglycan binding domain-containing protein n=1 Tax=Ruminococcus sp. SR1/5 TaxID=657323 RepID=UPI0001CD6875|nr:peptidoglycan binding domain-containing protein [Ruminococcus sp. SR1/5]CBL19126.1 Putative peptidoglycan binding domain [Ruminococcus sp. SR1/5]
MCKKENQTAPEDAYVAYKDSKFEIVPETEGNTLDFNGAYQALSEAITDKKERLT